MLIEEKRFQTERENAKSRLKQLEKDGLITRRVYTKKPPLKVEYALTPFGETLSPVLHAIAEWGQVVAKEKGEIIE